MKPLKSSNKLVSSVNNTTSFKMETSAETFEIFSSQIYEHKIRAIIRELSCNAYDAHVDAGNREVPFRIHFPTVFEPFFEVEDFGVGLDDYDVRGEEKVLYDEDGEEVQRYMEGGIYTTYFASSKRESNESIGHLGLGSKSPMAYTKSMTVIARKDGVERHYVCFIGEDGQPQTTFNSEKETDKGNGVRIRFSVANSDFDEFYREARFVLSLFKVKPETNVEIDTLLTDEEYDQLCENGALIFHETHPFVKHETATIYANMGGVVYPVRNIDYYYLGQRVLINEDEYNTGEADEPIYYEFDKATVDFIKSTIERNNKCMIINYPIGDLSFMPSREGLSQDTKTKFNLYKGLVETFYSKVKEMKDNINASRNELEAINSFAVFGEPNDLFAHNFHYKTKSIAEICWNTPFRILGDLDLLDDHSKIICHYKDYVGHHTMSRHSGSPTCVRRKQMYGLKNYDLHQWMKTQGSFDCFYCNDKDDYKGLNKAIRFYIKSFDVEENKTFFFYEPFDDEVFNRFGDVFYGNVNFRHISEIVDEVKAIDPDFFTKKARAKNNVKRVTRKKETKTHLVTWNKKKEEYTFSNSAVLVDMSKINPKNSAWVNKISGSSNYQVVVDGMPYTLSHNSLKLLMDHFDITIILVANGKNSSKIGRSDIPKLDDIIHSVVVNNKDEIINSYAWEMSNISGVRKTNPTTNTAEYIIGQHVGFRNRDTMLHLYKNDNFTKELVDLVAERFDDFYDTNNSDNHLRIFNKFVDYSKAYDKEVEIINEKDSIVDDFREVCEIVKKRYPLIFGVDSDSDAVLEYIELINQKHNNEQQQAKVA